METNTEEVYEEAEGSEEDLTAETAEDSKLVKHLRSELKKRGGQYDELASAVNSMKRESVLSKAGLELKPKQVEALIAAHGSEEFNPELVKKTAAELGFIQSPDLDIPDSEAKQLGNAAQASQGSATPGTPDEEFQGSLRNAKNTDEVLEILKKSGWADNKASRWGSSV